MPTIELIAAFVVNSVTLVIAFVLLITASVFATKIADLNDIFLQSYEISVACVAVAVITIVLTAGLFVWLLKQWPILSTIFSISLLAVILFLIIGLIALGITRGSLETSIMNRTTVVFDYYANSTNPQYSIQLIQKIQQSFKCCGLQAATDWSYLTIDGTSTPDSCCLKVSTGCGTDALVNQTGIYLRGCAQPVHDYFKLMYRILLGMNIALAIVAAIDSVLTLRLRLFMRQRYDSF